MTFDPDDNSAGQPFRLAIIAPTFNNGRTLREVLNALGEAGFGPVIVVDDGSSDATPAIVVEWARESSEHVALRHDTNQGKAAALFTGFAQARALGCTHALTIDTDGQHDVADAIRLRERAIRDPRAIVIGSREYDRHYPFRSRLGRMISNTAVRLISGQAVSDSQCGLRVYPLAVLEAVGARASRYAFETEVLTRAAWGNVPIVEVPIRCIYEVADGRVTHFRVLRDSCAAVALHFKLFHRALLPARTLHPVPRDCWRPGTIFDRGRRWLNPLRAWRQLRQDAGERERLAPSIGWGLFVGTQIPLGYKGALCLLLAKVFRLQPLVTIATSSLSTPPLGFILWAGAIATGHLLLHGQWPTPGRYDFRSLGAAAVVQKLALEWIIGGLVFGGALGLFAWLAVSAIVRWSNGLRSPTTQALRPVDATLSTK